MVYKSTRMVYFLSNPSNTRGHRISSESIRNMEIQVN